MVVIREVDRLAFSLGAGTNILNSNLVGGGCSIEELEEDIKSSGFQGFHIYQDQHSAGIFLAF